MSETLECIPVDETMTTTTTTTMNDATNTNSTMEDLIHDTSLSPTNCDTMSNSISSPESQSLSTSTTNEMMQHQHHQQPSSPSLTESSEPDSAASACFKNVEEEPAAPTEAPEAASVKKSQVLTSSALMLNQKKIDPELCELLQRRQPRVVPHAPKCPACDKSVYKAEEIRAASKTYHKLCFKCTKCRKLLQTNILTEHQGELFCRSCYSRNFGPKGYGFGVGSLSTEVNSPPPSSDGANKLTQTTSSTNISNIVNQRPPSTLRSTFSTYNAAGVTYDSSESSQEPKTSPLFRPLSERRISPATLNMFSYGGSDKCGRCNKPVYAAEKVSAAGKPYHKLCFACSACKKLLNSMNCCNNSENDVFCKACYGKYYGPKGVGYGIGAGTLQTS